MNQSSKKRTDNIIVISCCAGKRIDRPFKTQAGQSINFIANPTNEHMGEVPDGISDVPAQTWRDRINQFNEKKGSGFSCSLYAASDLYRPKAPYETVYTELAREYEHVYIFSAGWGIIRKNFMIPNYDITFQANAKNYNRRRAMWSDSIPIHDFNHLIDDFGPNGVIKKGNAYEERDIPIHLLAGISYRKRFIELAKILRNEIVIRYYGPSEYLRDRQRGLKLSICEYAPGRKVYRYTWVYQCAQEEYLKYRK